MNSIEAFENDIYLQLTSLKNFKPIKPIPAEILKKSLFCGAGDSYAAAMLAESFSNLKTHCSDPLDLLQNKSLLKNSTVFFISISGNTISNIRAARLAKTSFAISANKSGKLSKICKKTFLLDFTDSGIFTGGSISFLFSALTCMSLVTKFKMPDFKKIFDSAKKHILKTSLSGTVYILGNLHTYPIAMYMSAKFHELLGLDCRYERIEQFAHMGLFSTKKNDTVIILDNATAHNLMLKKSLQKIDLNVILYDIRFTSKINQVIFFTFVSQLLALRYAKKLKKSECFFVTENEIRDASSSMIY